MSGGQGEHVEVLREQECTEQALNQALEDEVLGSLFRGLPRGDPRCLCRDTLWLLLKVSPC